MPGPHLFARFLAYSALCLNTVLSQSEKQPELAAIPIIKDGEVCSCIITCWKRNGALTLKFSPNLHLLLSPL